MEELKQQKLEFRGLTKTMGLDFVMMPEDKQNAYFDRVKIYGEVAAMRWLQQQQKANAAPAGQ